MLFKNLCIYQLAPSFSITAAELESVLDARPVLEPTGLAARADGFEPIAKGLGRVFSFEKQLFFRYAGLMRVIPPSAVKREVARLADEWTAAHGHTPGRKVLRDLREKVEAEMTPKALLKGFGSNCWMDLQNGRLIVDATNKGMAEAALETLREALGSLPVTMLETEHSASGVMLKWLEAGEAPGVFDLDGDGEIAGVGETAKTLRFTGQDVTEARFKQVVADGHQVRWLGVSWNSRLAMRLSAQLQIKAVDYLGIEETGEESPELAEGQRAEDVRLEADLRMMVGDVGKMIDQLVAEFGGAKDAVESSGSAATGGGAVTAGHRVEAEGEHAAEEDEVVEEAA